MYYAIFAVAVLVFLFNVYLGGILFLLALAYYWYNS